MREKKMAKTKKKKNDREANVKIIKIQRWKKKDQKKGNTKKYKIKS